MKVNLKTVLLDLEDQAIEIDGPKLVDEKGNYIKLVDGRYVHAVVPMTVGLVCSRALISDQQGVNIDMAEKEERHDLAREIRTATRGSGEINLKSEQISKIKAQVNLNFTTIVVGQMAKLLEGKPTDGTN